MSTNTLIIFLAANLRWVLSNTITLVGQPSTVYEGRVTALTATAPVSTTVTNITFTINGVPHRELSDLSIQPVVLGMRNADLIINNIPVSLNGYSVGCTAELSTGVIVSCVPNITLQVQGTLGKVRNLNSEYSAVDRTLTISWTAPPAITIPQAAGPEIFYCVEINNGTATESIGCNRTEDMNEETSVIISDIVCGVNYDVTITPFNRVGDGVNSNVSFPGVPVIMERRDIPVLLLSSGNLAYTYHVSGLVCNCMATILDASVMGDLQCEPNATAGEITVTTNSVTTNRDFNTRIVASSFRKSDELTDNGITTYDIFDLIATSSVASQLDISLSFIQETRAQGAFMSFLFKENNGLTNFANSLLFIMNRATAANTNQLTPLPMGNYLVQAYDLEANGEISIEQPADQEMVTVTGPTSPGMPVLKSLGATVNCSSNLTADGSAVTVMCSYDSTIYSGYSVCIINQMEISPNCFSTESGSMLIVNGTINGEHEVFVNPTWRSSPPMGMLESPHRGTYTLIVITDTLPTTDPAYETSSTSYFDLESSQDRVSDTTTVEIVISNQEHLPAIIAGVIAVLVLISLVTITLLVIYIWRKKTTKNDEVYMKENSCYGTTQIPASAKPSNQLYSEISPDNATTNIDSRTDVEYEEIQPISHGGAAEVTLAHSYEVPVITKKSEN